MTVFGIYVTPLACLIFGLLIGAMVVSAIGYFYSIYTSNRKEY